MTDQPPAGIRNVFHQLGPVLTAAVMFTVSDVFGKLALEHGTDVLSLLSFRSILGIGLVFAWLRVGEPAVALSQMPLQFSYESLRCRSLNSLPSAVRKSIELTTPTTAASSS